jgi:TonB family protein
MATEFMRCVSIRGRLVFSIATPALCLGSAGTLTAAAQKTDKVGRRVLQNVKPDYPAVLRAAHLGGTVRLTVTVSASGNVTKIELLGGNPVLAESAIKAVTRWKFAPAAAPTSEEVQITFNPDASTTR